VIPRLAHTAYAWRRNPAWRVRLAEIRRIRGLSPGDFAAWQGVAVAEHLAHAQATMPYWRERVGARDELSDLPILTRRDVQRNAEALRDATRPSSALREDASGGSTGEPVRVWHDHDYATWVLASEMHVFETWGLEPWVRTAIVWGADRDLREIPWRERLWMRAKGVHVVNAFRMGDADLERGVQRLKQVQPGYIQGYASALEVLAAWLLEHAPAHGIRPRAIRSSAEVLTPTARARIERAFGCPVYDYYGSRESAALAAQCRHLRMHVQGHGRVVELVDDAGRPVAPGVPGRVLVTDFRNRAFGLIRYETGDVAVWDDAEACDCGQPYPALARIEGRTSDFITTPAGERIHGEWFTHLFYGRPGVERFQVHQPTAGRLRVTTVGPAGERDLFDLLAAIRARMGPDVEVSWRVAACIEDGVTGKRRFTISDVPYLPEGAAS